MQNKSIKDITSFLARAFLLANILVFIGCAGYRMGYFSMPYTGEKAPEIPVPKNQSEQAKQLKIGFAGLSIYIDLMNDIQTTDTAWFGIGVPMLPLKLDLKNKWRNGAYRLYRQKYFEGRDQFCFALSVFPEIEGVSFKPWKVVLLVNGISYSVKNCEYFIGPQERECIIKTDDINDKSIAFLSRKSHSFKLCFDLKRPTPDQDIQLYLSKSINHPEYISIPVIKFRLHRWRESYS